jgi:membrane dipeptidase
MAMAGGAELGDLAGAELIVDAHLDIAYNALLNGHDFQGEPAPGYAVSRQTLSGAGVGLVGATLMCAPASSRAMIKNLAGGEGQTPSDLFYRTARDAYLIAQAQVGYYRSVHLDLIRDRAGLQAYVRGWRRGEIAAILLLEGADAIQDPAELGAWAELGLRIVGLAWTRTRYSGGTGKPGGITTLGRQLLAAMSRQRLILDISHMADRAVVDAFELWEGPVMASHSNARSLVPGDRQISDATIKGIADRGGVIGISLFRAHLRAQGRAGVDDVARHVGHMASVIGSTEHIGIGSDLDGGFPVVDAAIDTVERLAMIEARLRKQFTKNEVEGIMGGNWLSFFERALPS